MPTITLVFVHGWSVTNLSTYGQLPLRIKAEAARSGLDLTIREIWLGQYVSFHDEVRLPDISRAFQAAVTKQLADLITAGDRFICITHSTGGPAIRDWWQRYYSGSADATAASPSPGTAATNPGTAPTSPGTTAASPATTPQCPLSHLIMLAPANFGSALAQLGKGTISRLASWAGGVEPGQGVLDWLELGSSEAWDLNHDWILEPNLPTTGPSGFYPFVLTGQSIDRKLYDHLNNYTGELGSDGVVRSAAANLNASLISIHQQFTTAGDGSIQPSPALIEYNTAPATAFRIVRNRSHSGTTMGIMNSVGADPATDTGNADTVAALMQCIGVATDQDYAKVSADFAAATDQVQSEERVEVVNDILIALTTRYFIHDRFCMVIFRVSDSEGYAVTDYDLIFTAGDNNNPNHLPQGFFADRQQNSLDASTVTYFVNYDILNGSPAISSPDGSKLIRDANPGITSLGLQLNPRPVNGFVRYMPLQLAANAAFFQQMVKPNCTILIDIRLQRLVSDQVFLNNGPIDTMPANGDFKDIRPGDNVVPFQTPT